MRTLNLGILAHVDAGKTSLTERLLFTAGVLPEPGSVDAGTTVTDSLAQERRRGITIRSAVVSFVLDDVVVNLVDTPGHPDFIAEVERVLGVLDGAVLVVSAVEGVQAQTRVLSRALQRLRIPTLVFVNKVDRRGARGTELVDSIRDRLGVPVARLSEVTGLGARSASVAARPDLLPALTEVLTETDDGLLGAWVDAADGVSASRVLSSLARQTAGAAVRPVLSGSAVTGAGIGGLTTAITALLPVRERSGDEPPVGTVFKVDRGPSGEQVAYVAMTSGALHVRDRISFGSSSRGKVTGLEVFDAGLARAAERLAAGRIGRVVGLRGVRIGDRVGEAGTVVEHHFPPPRLAAVVRPRSADGAGRLFTALTQLAEQDPLIAVTSDEERSETTVMLYGEVQREVVATTLAEDFGIEVDFGDTTTICVERVVGTGSAVDLNGAPDNPFLATVGLRVAPGAPGSGTTFGLDVELGSMPYAFFAAVEDTVRATLSQGLHGWAVLDCAVTMTASGYSPRQSHAHQGFDKSMSSTGADFRSLTPLVLMAALRQAGTVVCEPVERLSLDIPASSLDAVLAAVARLGGVPSAPRVSGHSCVLEGTLPTRRVADLRRELPSLTSGEGLLDSAPDRYEPVRGPAQSRPRTGPNPLDREDYLLRVDRNLARPARV